MNLPQVVSPLRASRHARRALSAPRAAVLATAFAASRKPFLGFAR